MSLFGGLDTELSPADVPEGISPGNQDVAYLPGSVFSRPGAHRVYYSALQGQEIVYLKTYVQPNGTIQNLIYTLQGNLYVENPLTNPGVLTLLTSLVANTRMMSVTAFGREYMAFSDGQHGVCRPLQWDGTNLDRVSQYGPGLPPTVSSAVGASTQTRTLQRAGSTVTVVTTTPHFLQVGYQVQISNVPASSIGGGIGYTYINNEDLPGVATVNMNADHGLVPGAMVSLTGIAPGGSANNISYIARVGQIVNVTMANPINWAPGASITINGCDPSFNGSFTILQIINAQSFTYVQSNPTDAVSTLHGTVSLNWPVPETSLPNYYEVQTCPTSKSFTIKVSYSDGTFGAGNCYYEWDGIFYVSAVINAYEFQYQQYGPAQTVIASGGVLAYGQASPGIHQMQVLYLTRQGYITKPSPPVQFVANGGQFINVQNIPIGPPNVIARILAFTGANGADFFYIPTAAIVNGQQVCTATQINDNTSTSAYLDFSDNTLFAASAINIPGNNLPAQVVLSPSLGVAAYANRLFWWGMANEVTNFVNLDFAGGSYSVSPRQPLGWSTNSPSNRCSLTSGIGAGSLGSLLIVPGGSAQIPGDAYQSAYQDAYGAPILQPNTLYTVRFLALTQTLSTVGSLWVDFYSPTKGKGILASAGISILQLSTTGQYFTVQCSSKTPLTIPPDTVLRVWTEAATVSVQITDIQIIYAQSPWLTAARASYVDNPEAYDGVTGIIGPVNDTISTSFQIRDELYFLSKISVHQTSDSVDAEPASWLIRQVASNCGTLSPWSIAIGEDWAVWASLSGLRGFAGGEPAKLSQEIQTLWDAIPAAQLGAVTVGNDPVNRRVYLTIPTSAASLLYVLDYRENDLMSQIIAAAPVKVSYTGRMVSSDLGRKWSIWNLPFTSVGTLSQGGRDVVCFGSTGNVYWMDPAKLADDDYGQIAPYYITYGFVNHDQEQALQLGSQRKLFKTLNLYVSGVGNLQITPLVDNLNNARPTRPAQQLSQNPARDLSWPLNVAGERMFLKISVTPSPGTTDCYFNLQKLMLRLAKHPMTPMRSAL